MTSHPDLGILVDTTLKFHDHIRSIVNKANGLASSLLKATLNRSRKFMVTVYKTHIRPLLEFSSCIFYNIYIGDLKLLESPQRRWTKNISGLENDDYQSRLHILDLYSVKGHLIRADMIKIWKIFHGHSATSPTELSEPSRIHSTRGHNYKLFVPHCNTEVRRRFFCVRTVTLWNSLPDTPVNAPTIATFKSALHHHLGNLLYEFCN